MDMSQRGSIVANDSEAGRRRIANELGLSVEQVTDALIAKITEDPLFLYHLNLCRADPEMLGVLLGEAESTNQVPTAKLNTVDLLARAGAALARWAASSFGRVDIEEYQRRVAICQSCEHLSLPPANSMFYRLIGTSPETKSVCKLCGCDVRKKAWLVTEGCPDARWR
jgi:hypothetical protein